jgi:hypothetical protein
MMHVMSGWMAKDMFDELAEYIKNMKQKLQHMYVCVPHVRKSTPHYRCFKTEVCQWSLLPRRYRPSCRNVCLGVFKVFDALDEVSAYRVQVEGRYRVFSLA